MILGDDLDQRVQTALQRIRQDGGTINRHIVIATGTAIVRHHQPSLLKEHGGSILLTRTWAESLMERMHFVQRKATKAARSLPDDFDKQKSDYLDTISTIVEDNDIPDSMIVNFDQTGVNIVPSSEWTMELKGEKQVSVAGLGDKRQITLVLGCTLSGELLPPQLIYQGKTEKCHPAFSFPDSWDIHHSPNHWSNTDTMIRYAEKVLIPYFERARDRLDLPSDHWGIAIFDLFRAHQHESFTKLLHQNHIHTKFVPASCTSELQPLDLSGNNSNSLRLNAAIVDTHRCARVLTGAKQCYFTTGKSPLFVLFIFVCSIMHVISK